MFEFAPATLLFGERGASDGDAHSRRLPVNARLPGDRFGIDEDTARDQTLATLVLACKQKAARPPRTASKSAIIKTIATPCFASTASATSPTGKSRAGKRGGKNNVALCGERVKSLKVFDPLYDRLQHARASSKTSQRSIPARRSWQKWLKSPAKWRSAKSLLVESRDDSFWTTRDSVILV